MIRFDLKRFIKLTCLCMCVCLLLSIHKYIQREKYFSSLAFLNSALVRERCFLIETFSMEEELVSVDAYCSQIYRRISHVMYLRMHLRDYSKIVTINISVGQKKKIISNIRIIEKKVCLSDIRQSFVVHMIRVSIYREQLRNKNKSFPNARSWWYLECSLRRCREDVRYYYTFVVW